MGEAVLQNPAGHGATAHLGVDDYSAEFSTFIHFELGRDDGNLTFHTVPVEEVFKLVAGQIDKDAVVRLYPADKPVGEDGLPVVEHGDTVVGQHHIAFEPVGVNPVEGAEQAIEKGSDEQMVVGIK